MAKKPASPIAATTPPAARSFWPAAIMIALLSGSVGALVTYVILEPRLQPAPAATVPAVVSTPAVRASAPEPVAGQTSAQTDRASGNFYYDRSDWALAVKYYEAAIRQGSDDADIRTDLGNAYRFSNRPDDALTQYRAAQGMNPQHEFSLFNQGGLYFEQFKNPAQAIAIWREYLQRFPQGASAAAARQLIAQAQGGSTTPANLPDATPVSLPKPAGAAAPADPTEARLMQLVKPKP